ncbi:hypothetical protein GWI33_012151, partial [Rhynchophorus ferrugineus]
PLAVDQKSRNKPGGKSKLDGRKCVPGTTKAPLTRLRCERDQFPAESWPFIGPGDIRPKRHLSALGGGKAGVGPLARTN